MRTGLFVVVVATALFAIAPPLMADSGESEPEESTVEQPEGFVPPYTPGTFDMTLGAGFRGMSFLYAEPGFDLGVIGGDAATLSVGASVNAGVCVVCLLIDVASDYRVRGWYTIPLARVALHLNTLADGLDADRLDLYGGLMGGPGYYRYSLENEAGDRFQVSQVTALFGPFAGLRHTLSGYDGFFLYGEFRHLLEAGTTRVTVQYGDDDEEQILEATGEVNQGGWDTVVGIGLRF